MNDNTSPANPDWDDLRLCLAVLRHGTVSSAAGALGMSHSTLLRRIAAFEERLGVVLFRRKASGYEVNEAGERLIEAAMDIEAQVAEAIADISGQDAAMRGAIRFAVPDASGTLLMTLVRPFQDENKHVAIHFEVAQTPSSITTGNAHVAVVLTAAAPPGQMGTPIGPVAFAAYARSSLLGAAQADAMTWVGLAPALHSIPVGRFDRRLARHFARVHVCGAVALHHAAVRTGLGAGLLPCAVGDSDPDLVRVSGLFCDPQLTLWVLHRKEMRANARVLAFYRFVRQAIMSRKRLIAGEEPSKPTIHLAQLHQTTATDDDDHAE